MDSDSKIFVAGHNGLVGSAIVRNLEAKGFTNIITMDRAKLDLTKLHDVQIFFAVEQPEYVFLAAAKVGGIGGNADYPADFIYQNLMIQSNVIHSSYISGVKKLLFLGSSCIYPKFPKIPITEDQLLDNIAWTLVPKQSTVASDENRDIFREYTYLIGGDNGTLLPFTTFQLKIVMRSSNSSKVPIIRDLRAIALGV